MGIYSIWHILFRTWLKVKIQIHFFQINFPIESVVMFRDIASPSDINMTNPSYEKCTIWLSKSMETINILPCKSEEQRPLSPVSISSSQRAMEVPLSRILSIKPDVRKPASGGEEFGCILLALENQTIELVYANSIKFRSWVFGIMLDDLILVYCGNFFWKILFDVFFVFFREYFFFDSFFLWQKIAIVVVNIIILREYFFKAIVPSFYSRHAWWVQRSWSWWRWWNWGGGCFERGGGRSAEAWAHPHGRTSHTWGIWKS